MRKKIDIRISDDERATVRRAAQLLDLPYTRFIRRAAIGAAMARLDECAEQADRQTDQEYE